MIHAKSAMAATAMAVSLWASAASAATTTRDVLGWTSTGLVVVHLTERGERMVDGISKDYYGEATEVWGASDKPTLFKHGEAVGPVPKHLADAQDPGVGDKYRQGLLKDTVGSSNAAGTRRVVWHSRQRIDRPDERNFVCKLTYRILVLDDASRRAYTLHEATAAGELARRQDEAYCPKLDVDAHWSEDGTGLILADAGGAPVGLFIKGSELESKPWAAYVPTQRLISRISTGDATAWDALAAGKLDEAATAFEAAESPGGVAMIDAIRGEKKALRNADAAYKKSKKTGRDAILRAAAYAIAGQGSKATKWIDEAVQAADTYATLLEFAVIFEVADPGIANQLAVHALSHPTAADADTADGWKLLARGLVDVGEYSKAEESLGNVKTTDLETLALQAEISLDRKQTKQATTFAEDLLFDNPGDCNAYLLQGRLASMDGNNVQARALFEAANACDPTLEDAAFYVADFARLSGDIAASKDAFDQYLRLAPPRGSDQIRTLRREIAKGWSDRFAHDGVVITDVACRRGRVGFICTGTLKNTLTTPTGEVAVEVRVGRKAVGQATVADIEAKGTSPFGVSFEAKKLSDVRVTAGRDKGELKTNEQSVR